jgi:hypothetical protein
VVKFDQFELPNVQVQANVGVLHRAIDRAMSLHNHAADRHGHCNTNRRDRDGGLVHEQEAVINARAAPAPAAADLVFASDSQ